jgi:hypothetical protein
MAKSRDINKEAVQEIERQLLREDTDSAECVLHISGVLNDVRCYEEGRGDRMVYLPWGK